MSTLLPTLNSHSTIMKYATLLTSLLLTPAISFADDAAKAKLMETGKAQYAVCAACHGPEGAGVAMGAMKMGPTLVSSKIATGDPAVLALVLQNGIAKESTTYPAPMAAMGATMDDEKLAGVMTYVRNSFGNTASVVTAEDVKKYRAANAATTGPVTRAKIDELEKAAEKK
jgi:mono/diheme cytochrome c family protein